MAWIRCCGGNSTPVVPRPITLSELVGLYDNGTRSRTSNAFTAVSTDIFTFSGWSNYTNTVVTVDVSIDNASTWTRVHTGTMTAANTSYTFNVSLATYNRKTVLIKLGFNSQASSHAVQITSAVIN